LTLISSVGHFHEILMLLLSVGVLAILELCLIIDFLNVVSVISLSVLLHVYVHVSQPLRLQCGEAVFGT